MNTNYNNINGTVSETFALGAGSEHSVRQFLLTAKTTTADVVAATNKNDVISVSGVEFFDVKVVAKNVGNLIVAKQLHGTIYNGVVTRIEEIFQEEFAADVTLSSVNNVFTILCAATSTDTSYTIHCTLTKV